MALRTSQHSRLTGTRRWAAACAAAAVVTTLGGCGSSTPSDRLAATSFKADSWLDALTAADDAGPAQVDPERISTTRGGVPHTVLGVGASGRLLVSQVTGRRTDQLGTPHVGWLGASDFIPLAYDADQSRGHQVTAADHDGSDVVWVETTSTDPGLFDWTVWSSSGKDRRQVDSSARLGPADRPKRVFGMTEPVVAEGRTFWAATTTGTAAVVLSAPLTGGKPAAEPIGAAGLPALSQDTLYFVRSSTLGSDDGTTRIVARDLGSKHERVVAQADLGSGKAVTRLVASDHHLAWVVSDAAAGASQLFVKDLRSGVTRGIRMNHPGLQTMALGLSDRLVVWGNGSAEGDAGEYALDLGDGAIWRLGDQPGFSVVFVDGDTVAWADLPKDPKAAADFRVSRWKGAAR
jgi:hypothetical protein